MGTHLHTLVMFFRGTLALETAYCRTDTKGDFAASTGAFSG